MYDELAEAYDLMIYWKSRLKREKLFLNKVFKEHGVRRILDTACGTGMHAIAFHDWGYHVVGTEISAGMLEKAAENADDRPIEFALAGFTELEKVGGMFDAATCLGNSLPHVLTDEELDRSLKSMFEVLLPGGVLIYHGNNYGRILGRRERFMPLSQGKRAGTEHIFMRFFDFEDDLLTFNVVRITRKSGKWEMFPESLKHRPMTRGLLVDRMEKTGFKEILVFGSFAGEAFEELDSDNLILVAQKPHTITSCPPKEPMTSLEKVPIRESGEPLVDATEVATELDIRVSPVYGRKTVVEMLRKAQSLLPEGHRLQILNVLRTLENQRELYTNFYEKLRSEHPDWPVNRLSRETNKFVAPPDTPRPPGHTTGGAVDLTIVGPDGEELDMTSMLDPTISERLAVPTYSKVITPRAARNRQLLVDVMTAVGFSNYPGEWWHFSYGESAWAYRTGASYAIYGAAPTPLGTVHPDSEAKTPSL